MKDLTKKQAEELNNLTTVSAKVRYLNKLGYTRSQIANKLEKRYQHVRNVLVAPIPKHEQE